MPLLASLALRFCCWSRRATAVLAFAACAVGPAAAQAPYDVSDPFYQEETARRAFYDGFAFSAEAAYRPRGLLSQAEADGPNPLAFA
ncbi:MAG: hypothetical protein R3362_07460, partial [Rhodothermales bacterium]|nr:hypothetical protein [Rhodothermales bacterium]